MNNQTDHALLDAVMAALPHSIAQAENESNASKHGEALTAMWARLSPAIAVATNLAVNDSHELAEGYFLRTVAAKAGMVMEGIIDYDNTGNSINAMQRARDLNNFWHQRRA